MSKRATTTNNRRVAAGVVAVNNDCSELRCSMIFIRQREAALAISGHGDILPWLSIAMVPTKAKSVAVANNRRMSNAKIVLGSCIASIVPK